MDMKNVWDGFAKYLRGDSLDIGLFRIVMEEIGGLGTEPIDVTYEEIQCPGTVRPAIWCRPLHASPSRVILYLHGGAFIAGSPASHRRTAGHLANMVCAHALLVDYRRAPEHQFPSQIEDVVAAYKWLLNDQGIASSNIAFAGDSAGGNLTVSVSLALREQMLPLPAVIAAFSPWLDLRVSGESYVRNKESDALAQPESLPDVVASYVGSASIDNPLVDILRTDLKGLPPMYLATGTAEVLEDDAVTLAKNARAAGIDVELELGKDLQHIWVTMVGNSPEADNTLSKAAQFMRSKMGN